MARRPQELRLDVDADLQRLDADTALPTLRSALKQARYRILARASCAMGLSASGEPRTLIALVDLLADPEHGARAGASRATACTEPLAAEAVLRTKVLEKHIASRDERALLHAFATH